MSEQVLRSIDESLIGLRHLWSAPPRLQDPDLGSVEMSTVWVVDTLMRSPGREQTITGLADAMGVTQSTASRLVSRAQSAGTVLRRSDSEDSRRVLVTITDRGADLATAGLGFRLRKLALATADWTEADRAHFAGLLRRFTTSMEGNP